MAKRSSWVVPIVVLCGFAVVGALMYLGGPTQPRSGKGAQQPAASVDRSALIRFHSPSFGDANAKVDIVEFFDPVCDACRAVYPFVKKLMDENPGRVRLTLRYAPFHRGADQIVRLLEAAGRQGKYWQTLEVVLATQRTWTINNTVRLDLALKEVASVGLDMQRLQEDMQRPELARLMALDLNDAAALKVSGTPEFYINGRPLPKLGLDELKAAVDSAVREAYR
jgi:protein-disulfide isomerase